MALYRELADDNPGRYRPGLAGSLSSLSFALSELGRSADALAATEEAVAMYRELAATDPDRYRPGLARSLSSLGFALSELERSAAALAATEEVALYRELADRSGPLPPRSSPLAVQPEHMVLGAGAAGGSCGGDGGDGGAVPGAG